MSTPKKLQNLIDSMQFGERYLCISSSSKFFSSEKTYPVQYDEEGYVYLEDESGSRVYTVDDAFEYKSVVFVRDTNKIGIKDGTAFLPQRRTLNSEDKEMTPSKVRETINRLNGVKPFQDRLVSLRQTSSSKKTVNLDLAHLLLTSEDIKALKPGEDCLITGLDVDLHSGQVTVHSSVGKVDREENKALASALTDLVSTHVEAES